MKQTIRLTESDIRKMIMESINVVVGKINESHGLGYGMSDNEKRKVRDEHSDMRKHSHYTGRGVKQKPGEKAKKTYDILKREGDRGNPWSKTLKKGGAADWVANMQDDDTNESVERKTIKLTENDIRRMVMEALDGMAGNGGGIVREMNIAISELEKYISEDPSREYDLSLVMNKLRNVQRYLESHGGSGEYTQLKDW